MKVQRFLIAVFIMFMMFGAAFSNAQDSTPTPDGVVTEIAAEATAEVTQEADVVIIIEQPTDETPPDTTTINNGFSFAEFAVTMFGFILTIFAGFKMFVVPIIKSNAELAHKLGEYTSPESIDKWIGGIGGAQEWAKTLTPAWSADDIALAKIRKEVEDLKLLFFPEQPSTTEEPPMTG